MELDSAAKHRQAFYRLVGTVSSDDALVENSEAADDVCYLYLTRGYRAAQRYLIDFVKMEDRWVTRSSAITWSGTDAADGGQYVALPANFLRFRGPRPITDADFKPWGKLVDEIFHGWTGSYYYLKNDQLWKVSGASAPSPAYFDYHHHHAAITSLTSTFDMPPEARHLAIAFAANDAMLENWFPGADRNVIREALANAKIEAKQLRRTHSPNRMRPPVQYGTAW